MRFTLGFIIIGFTVFNMVANLGNGIRDSAREAYFASKKKRALAKHDAMLEAVVKLENERDQLA